VRDIVEVEKGDDELNTSVDLDYNTVELSDNNCTNLEERSDGRKSSDMNSHFVKLYTTTENINTEIDSEVKLIGTTNKDLVEGTIKEADSGDIVVTRIKTRAETDTGIMSASLSDKSTVILLSVNNKMKDYQTTRRKDHTTRLSTNCSNCSDLKCLCSYNDVDMKKEPPPEKDLWSGDLFDTSSACSGTGEAHIYNDLQKEIKLEGITDKTKYMVVKALDNNVVKNSVKNVKNVVEKSQIKAIIKSESCHHSEPLNENVIVCTETRSRS